MSGFLLGITAAPGGIAPRLLTGVACAAACALFSGVLAAMSFPGRTLIACKICGGPVAPDAHACPHCATTDFAASSDDGRVLLTIGALVGTGFGFFAGLIWAPPGFVAHLQGAIVYTIVGGYAGGTLAVTRLIWVFAILP